MASSEPSTGTMPCVFCAIAKGELTPEVIAYRDSHTVVFPDLHQQPRNQGHMLVVPTVHVPHIYDMDRIIGGALMETLSVVAKAVKNVWTAGGISIRQNNEAHGGQDVFHVHFHVVPRFENDRFNQGKDRFPFGAIEVPLEERVRQTTKLREELGRLRHLP